MTIKELEKSKVIFEYPLHQIKWPTWSIGKMESVLVSFYSMLDDIGQSYYVINVHNIFNSKSTSELEIQRNDILFGPVLTEQPLLRGEKKWRDILRLEKSDSNCFHPKFYGATSKRSTNEQRQKSQYYWKPETSEYHESTFDRIGHLESPTIYNEFTMELRTYLEVLRFDDANITKEKLKPLLLEAVECSEVFEGDSELEKEKWIIDFVDECFLVPNPKLLDSNLRGRVL